MTTTQAEPSRVSVIAIVGTIIPAVLVLALYVMLLWVVPSYKRIFDQFGLTLPWMAIQVIRLSHWIAEYWWTTMPSLMVVGVGNYFLLRSLGQHSWVMPIVVILGVSLLLTMVLALVVVSIEIPMIKLKEGLAR